MVKLYIDVLLITNLVISIVQIGVAAAVTHSKIPPARLLAAGGVGALSSLTVLLPGYAAAVCIKIFLIAASAGVAFKTIRPKELLRKSAVLAFVRLTFTALVFLIWHFARPCRLYIIFGTVYLDVSILTLIFSCCGCYLVLSLIERLWDRYKYENTAYSVSLTLGGREYRFEALADTGNLARDYLTGKPVVVIMSEKICTELGLRNGLPRGFRLLPVSTVGGSSLMWLTKPQSLKITSGRGTSKQVGAYVGLVDSTGEQAVFNPCLLG